MVGACRSESFVVGALGLGKRGAMREVPSLHLPFTHFFVSIEELILIRRLKLHISQKVNLNILNTLNSCILCFPEKLPGFYNIKTKTS